VKKKRLKGREKRGQGGEEGRRKRKRREDRRLMRRRCRKMWRGEKGRGCAPRVEDDEQGTGVEEAF